MLAVAATTAVLVALIVAALAVPLVLVISAERVDALKATWRVRWLFGLVDVRSSRDRPASPPPERSETASTARGRSRKAVKGARVGIAVLRTHGLPGRVRRLAGSLFQRVKLEEFQLRTAFGLDNPADTGIVCGLLSPLLVIARMRDLNVDFRPMFLETGLRGVLSATVHVRPLSIVGPLAAFLVSPPVIRAARSAWQARK